MHVFFYFNFMVIISNASISTAQGYFSTTPSTLTEDEQNPINCSNLYDSHTSPNGYVVSPNYPLEYPNNIRCVYDFQGKQNERVILNIEEFDLEPAQLISVLRSNGHSLHDKSGDILIRDSSTRPTTEPSESNNDFSEVADAWQCFYDYLDVFSYDVMGFYRLRSRICGRHKELQIVSTSPKFRLIFESDRSLRFKGFRIRYHFSYLNILPFITYKICGNSQIEGEGGKLSSPNYPNTFPSNVECAWTITVEKHKKILIKFVDINFNEPCHLSYVRIWDGYMDNPEKPDLNACQKLMFYLKGQKHFLSKTNRMVIKFNGNKASSTFLTNDGETHNASVKDLDSSNLETKKDKNGFLLTWTAVYQDDDCLEFQCKGGEFCIDTKNVICQKTVAYCINKSLVCDGYSHCDVGDKSDEENCNFYFATNELNATIIAIGSSAAAFVLLSIIIICIIRHRIKSNKAKMEALAAVRRAEEAKSEKYNIKYYCAKPREKIIKEDSLNRYILSSTDINPTNIQRKKDQVLFRIWKSDPLLYKQILERIHPDNEENNDSDKETNLSASKSLSASQKRLSYMQAQSVDIVNDRNCTTTNNNNNLRVYSSRNLLDPNLPVCEIPYRRNSYRKAFEF